MASHLEELQLESGGDKKTAFCLVHGAWHGSWCWDYLTPELEARGHQTIAPNLPISDEDANYDDYAEIIVDDILQSGAQEVILVPHSRGGNFGIRAANILEKMGEVSLKKIIYVTAAVDESTIGWELPVNQTKVTAKTSMARQFGERITGNMSELDNDELIKFAFYYDCIDEIAQWAVDQQRPQRLPNNETQIEHLPSAMSEYIVCKNDRVILEDYQLNRIATYLLKIPKRKNRIFSFSSGHSPMLSHSADLADLLSERAKLTQNPPH